MTAPTADPAPHHANVVPLRTAPRRRRGGRPAILAVLAGAIGFPTAIWFNAAVLPTDGPGPIGFATILLIILLLYAPDRRPAGASGGDAAHE